ncbi:MAG: glycosyltransferase family 4 protein [Blastocatellia bacterium]
MRLPLVYALHSGNLYGTERMALATAANLTDEFEPVIFAPPGPALGEAARMGFAAESFTNPLEFAWKMHPFLSRHRKLAFVATGVTHSLACLAWNRLYRREVVHLHMVHGGTDEALSYGRKRRLNGAPVTFVAVSGFVKERLAANGVTPDQIAVIENFLPDRQIAAAPKRLGFEGPGVRRLIVISRIDPIKRLDVLLDALDRHPELAGLSVSIFGTGWQLDEMRARAGAANPNVTFAGFHNEVAGELAQADLLVHTCPEEPFGLAIIEAMAAHVPVLVPDSGGAGSLVEEGVSGFRFAANRAESLAARLRDLSRAPEDLLNRVVAGARQALATRFSAQARTTDYRRLLHGGAR